MIKRIILVVTVVWQRIIMGRQAVAEREERVAMAKVPLREWVVQAMSVQFFMFLFLRQTLFMLVAEQGLEKVKRLPVALVAADR